MIKKLALILISCVLASGCIKKNGDEIQPSVIFIADIQVSADILKKNTELVNALVPIQLSKEKDSCTSDYSVFPKFSIVRYDTNKPVITLVTEFTSKTLNTDSRQNLGQKLFGAKASFEKQITYAREDYLSTVIPKELTEETERKISINYDYILKKVNSDINPSFFFLINSSEDQKNNIRIAAKNLKIKEDRIIFSNTGSFMKNAMEKAVCLTDKKENAKNVSVAIFDMRLLQATGVVNCGVSADCAISPPVSNLPSERKLDPRDSQVAPLASTPITTTPIISSNTKELSCTTLLGDLEKSLTKDSWDGERRPWTIMVQLMVREDCSEQEKKLREMLCETKVRPIVEKGQSGVFKCISN